MSIQNIFTLILVISFNNSYAKENLADKTPECAAILSKCSSAGFTRGGHKDKKKGLWMDCIFPVAKGKTPDEVSAKQEDAKSCLQALKSAKQARRKAKQEKKKEKKKSKKSASTESKETSDKSNSAIKTNKQEDTTK